MAPRRRQTNKLNDLSNREWLRRTKSFWISEGTAMPAPPDEDGQRLADFLERFGQWLREREGDEAAAELLGQVIGSFMPSQTPPRDDLKAQHPATFPEPDVQRLIELFTKRGDTVLDPFVGTGSTLIACARCGRGATGVELTDKWVEIARKRLEQECAQTSLFDESDASSPELRILHGDARDELVALPNDSFDFVVTSPPYWTILRKGGMKVAAERGAKDLATTYSDSDADLGNVPNYEGFLAQLDVVWGECHRVLKPGRYAAIVVCDFRHGRDFYLYHADIAEHVRGMGLRLQGVTILAQDNKNLYPYGIPNAFVSNIHHQYILIFRKDRREGAAPC
ncbi:MAG: DNA methyltransferase [Armatimonadota bacterium]|jgi:DNA modification methylase